MSVIVGPEQTSRTAELGGKAGALARLTAAGFPVPAWVVITPDAFAASVTEAQRSAIVSPGGTEADDRTLDEICIAPAIEAELLMALQTLGDESTRYAVRSSALEEDSVRYSFAGQLESYLFVAARDVPRCVVDVWRSAFSKRVLAYRREHGLSASAGAPAVLVQRMVDADVSGVAFSADPVSGDRRIAVVGSLYGLGSALVSGDAEADTHHVDVEGRIVERRVAAKTLAHRASPHGKAGVTAVEVDSVRAGLPALRDEQIVAVAELARRAERFFARPQDIEWAIADGELHMLQSRPITSRPDVVDSRGALAIWDNSNIVESYGGITTPLTFTFARNAYAGVYEQLCKIFGARRDRIEANRDALANMLGLIRGRIYYNLVNWYRLLAILPGYKMNSAFLEQMLGIKESAPAGVIDGDGPVRWYARAADAVHFARAVLSIVLSYFTLPMRTKRFYRRVEGAINTGALSSLRADELAAEYRRLEGRLIRRWDAPQINDFFAMVFFGLLRRLGLKWCADTGGTLQNGLLSESGGMVSTEPARRVTEMAGIARLHPELAEALRSADTQHIIDVMARYPDFATRYQSYLDTYGDRCVDELKLESRTLHENPLMLMRSVGHLAQSAEGSRDDSARGRQREESERRARAALGWNPLRRGVFWWVLGNARRYVRGRENMRLQRTRVFARVRAIFVELGRRLHAMEVLDDPRDIFYLEMDEVLGFVNGATVTTDLRGLAALRKDEFSRYAQMDPPADRFETRGTVHHGNTFRRELGPNNDGDQRTGTGCCPGRVAGRVRVVLDPGTATLRHGDILAAERTDPSWVMLFPFARGLLVERGSLLSHSAIVAREMGIPAVVSIAGLTGWLKDGDWVEFDGTTGVVRKTAPPAESA